ncbi:MAG: hypothetical protein RLZZ220_370 [Pseudomonadota bacterium]
MVKPSGICALTGTLDLAVAKIGRVWVMMEGRSLIFCFFKATPGTLTPSPYGVNTSPRPGPDAQLICKKPESRKVLLPCMFTIMNINIDVDTLWSLWAAADPWASGGKRAAFSTVCPWGSALVRSGGNRRSRLSSNPQRLSLRARRRSLLSLGANKPV